MMPTVATWNVGNKSDDMVIRGLVRLVKAGVDVLCLQECGDRRHVLEEFSRRTGWHGWLGDGSPGAASVPILWNPKAVRARRTGTTKATGPTKVGSRGAGPSKMKAKVWNRVRFTAVSTLERGRELASERDDLIASGVDPGDLVVPLAGRGEHHGPFVVINGHVVPSVYLPPRRRLARRHIAVLARMVRRRKGRVPVVAVGDFNMRPGDSLTRPLRALGMTQCTKAPTHGRRTIDHIWTLGLSGSTTVLDMPSDHRAVLLTIKETR